MMRSLPCMLGLFIQPALKKALLLGMALIRSVQDSANQQAA